MIECYYIPSPNPEGRRINNLIRLLERAIFQGDLSDESAVSLIHECTGCCSPESLRMLYEMAGRLALSEGAADYSEFTPEDSELERKIFERP